MSDDKKPAYLGGALRDQATFDKWVKVCISMSVDIGVKLAVVPTEVMLGVMACMSVLYKSVREMDSQLPEEARVRAHQLDELERQMAANLGQPVDMAEYQKMSDHIDKQRSAFEADMLSKVFTQKGGEG